MRKPRILVVGAGAIGTFFAARFASSGFEVSVLARGDRLEFLKRHGAQFRSNAAIDIENVSAQDHSYGLPQQDWIIICTKGNQLEIALRELKESNIKFETLVTIQNGVDAPVTAARLFPESKILSGRIHGFFELTDHVSIHVGVQPSVSFGAIQTGAGSTESEFARALSAAQIPSTVEADISAVLWEKFILACSVGGVGAATGLNAGLLLSNEASSSLLRAALQEGVRIGRVTGIKLADNMVGQALDLVATFPASATTSLQRDLEQGAPSEYATLVGAMLRMAHEARVSARTFKLIDQRIRGRGLCRAHPT
jgi:2-dehydropantoate 2-reductase